MKMNYYNSEVWEATMSSACGKDKGKRGHMEKSGGETSKKMTTWKIEKKNLFIWY
jgi:hypothetical protein